jgi:predicted phosphoribosyltransferase
VLAASVLADLTAKAGEEAITTAAQVRQFALEQAAGPFTKKLSEGLAQGLADKANSLWGTNRQAKENAADRARTEVRQQLIILLDDGLAQGRLATLVSEDERAAIAEAIADEFAGRLAIQMRARIRSQSSNTEPFTG